MGLLSDLIDTGLIGGFEAIAGLSPFGSLAIGGGCVIARLSLVNYETNFKLLRFYIEVGNCIPNGLLEFSYFREFILEVDYWSKLYLNPVCDFEV